MPCAVCTVTKGSRKSETYPELLREKGAAAKRGRFRRP